MKTWVVTGAAGFIGSNLVEELLLNNQKVIAIDNFITGKRYNLDEIRLRVAPALWRNLDIIDCDIRSHSKLYELIYNADIVCHQAALGSVPRSFKETKLVNDINVNGFLNILDIMRKTPCKRLVFASSSSVYGDNRDRVKLEFKTGKVLSPYALTKKINEEYASLLSRDGSFEFVGLRYFNVFGKKQDPNSEYSAVIPRWIKCMLKGESPVIYGDGRTTRDFTPVKNVVRANILAGTIKDKDALNQFYNISLGQCTSLLDLYKLLGTYITSPFGLPPEHGSPRIGDVQHSQGSITQATVKLGYNPTVSIEEGLKECVEWYQNEIK